VCECDLIDVQAFVQFNDNFKYLLTVINVFSKYFHIVPLKSKSGTAVTSAFKSILEIPKYSKRIQTQPIWFRTDKGKEFLNRQFQDMLISKGIQFQVFEILDLKFSIDERAQRNIRYKLYKYITYSNSNRYIDVLQKFVDAYKRYCSLCYWHGAIKSY